MTINGFTAGSVVVNSTVIFLSGVTSSAQTYQNAMISGNTSQIFGTEFGTVSVAVTSVQAFTVANPSAVEAAPPPPPPPAAAGARNASSPPPFLPQVNVIPYSPADVAVEKLLCSPLHGVIAPAGCSMF